MDRIAQFPAWALWVLMSRFPTTLPKDGGESVLDGWDPRHPAQIRWDQSYPPTIMDGAHRLSMLRRAGLGEVMVPTEIVEAR